MPASTKTAPRTAIDGAAATSSRFISTASTEAPIRKRALAEPVAERADRIGADGVEHVVDGVELDRDHARPFAGWVGVSACTA